MGRRRAAEMVVSLGCFHTPPYGYLLAENITCLESGEPIFFSPFNPFKDLNQRSLKVSSNSSHIVRFEALWQFWRGRYIRTSADIVNSAHYASNAPRAHASAARSRPSQQYYESCIRLTMIAVHRFHIVIISRNSITPSNLPLSILH